ncbi:ABC transporter ATP-binding protein [Amaricoccus solimangrovi]|uniref:ATP-binding cassette domain-containing protein n=1 Tax=Amaricoccus solimangrovi TaxID=2589815 RepID=A0A501WVF9_9RHOB|nr:ATP-binding cassette domain-containing protein [Amaricoccus solimangrovi]TPE49866.1 ATP-binding cassette domain-containing protein [Amaricoccus solimangrovi]
MARLAIRNLVARFPGLDQPALDVPAFDLDAGARIALRGPSGSGKTTFLNMLTGLARVPEGHVTWDGIDLATLGEGARDRWRAANVGLVMQDFHLFPGLSALENVLLPRRLRWRGAEKGAREEALGLLRRTGVPRPDQPVETLSRGQSQRVAVARALLGRPAILVADEPTASLDAEAGAAVGALLTDLARETGATLVVATHDPELIERIGRVAHLTAGRLAA